MTGDNPVPITERSKRRNTPVFVLTQIADYALELSAVLASLEEAHIAPHRAPIRSPGQGGSRAAQQPGAVTGGGGTRRANDAPRRRRAQW